MPVFNLNRSSRRPATSSHRPHHGSPPKQGHITSDHPLDQQLFDYMIVVDFECTCERDRRAYPNEIIEFPGVLVDVRRGIVDKERSFHSYVKPWRNPQLTQFCTQLTGITQDKVDKAPTITEAVAKFIEWYRKTIPRGAKVVFATDGPWDFKNFLYTMAVLRDNVAFPTIFYEYIDIRTTFARIFNKGDPIKLDAMLKKMKLRFEGSPHCGFDDAVNIARLGVEMMKRGCIFQFLIALPLDADEFHYDLEGIPLYRREAGSGFVPRDDVEEAAKKCFGEAYFTFAKKHKKEVEMYRQELAAAKVERAAAASANRVITRKDGGVSNWEVRRNVFVAVVVALIVGALIGLLVLR
jgi:inhibitor of KinA sporulation pathway (predicted exonuclease)